MLLLQIILTVVAWSRGWKGRALLPWLITFWVGYHMSTDGGDPRYALEAAGVLDLISVGVLSVMALVAPSRDLQEPAPHGTAAPVTPRAETKVSHPS